MIRGTSGIVDWESMGAILASLSDEEQAAFFHGFCKEMFSWKTCVSREMQLAFVNKHLSEEERELLSMLGFRS